MTKENAEKFNLLIFEFHPMMKRHFKRERFIAITPPQQDDSSA